MKRYRAWQAIRFLAVGAIMLQAGGCDLGAVNNFLQTVFLGITAAGSVAILQNV
ncbi:MAG: hypothetical protein HY763_03760 [Planctomycetes bacterium]|nr:hypothetical protein [Planctomycetota bacterium]